MNDFQQSIPISRRIQAAFMAMLVTIVVPTKIVNTKN